MAQKRSRTAAYSNLPEDGEISLVDLLSSFWATRSWVSIAVILSSLLMIAIVALTYSTIPAFQSYRHAVQFTFLESDELNYPNGAAFNLGDIKATSILQNVYETNDLEDHGLSVQDFTESVAVEPYAPTYSVVAANFRKRLENRQLTVTEREEIEAEMRTALQSLRSRIALVSINLPDNLGLSDQLGRKLAMDIPEAWSEFYIGQLGAVAVPEAVSSNNIANQEFASSLDFPLLVDYLENSFDRTKQQLETLTQLDIARGSSDPETGKSAYDLVREIEDLENFRLNRQLIPFIQLGFARDAEFVALVYQDRIKSLEREIRSVDERIAAFQDAIDDIRSDLPHENLPTAQLPGSANIPGVPPTVTSIPQFGDNFIDRLIELSTSKQGFDYRRDLSTRQLELREQKISLAQELERTRDRLVAMTANSDTTGSAATIQPSDVISRESTLIIDGLNEIWQATNRLFSQVSAERLNYNGKLYRSIPLEDPVVSSHPVKTSRTFFVSVGAVLAAGIIAMFAHLVWQVMRRRTKVT